MSTKILCDQCKAEMPQEDDKCFYLVDKKAKVVFAISPWADKGYRSATVHICDACGAKALERAELIDEDAMKKLRNKWR